MKQEQELKQKADTLLSLREDLYEMHFHQIDREWIIEAMIDFAALNHMYFEEKSEKPINLEISDDEIKSSMRRYNIIDFGQMAAYVTGAKWVLEQIKK